MKTKASSVEEIRKQTRNLIDAHKKSIQDFHENHFPHLCGREGMTDIVKALRSRATWETATGITEPHQHIDWMAAEEIPRLREENARLREALIDILASLVASVDLLERGGKKAAPSDKMFAQMLVDYKNSIERGRAVAAAIQEGGKNE